MTQISEPLLAPPGAGLPKVELVIARAMFMIQRLSGNRQKQDARFEHQRLKIRQLQEAVAHMGPDAASRRVLIKRLPGLEDSSRYWSVWMTLDHLRIMHGGMNRIIQSLGKGVQMPGAASTAAVKPSPLVTGAVVAEYEQSCDDLLATIRSVDNLRTPVRFTHPWFGPLDAAGWHAMAAMHLSIHRAQIESILAKLKENPLATHA